MLKNTARIITCLLFSFTTPLFAHMMPSPPDLAAEAYVLRDFNSNRILAQKNMNQRVDPASLTKMMTMYVIDTELKEKRIKETDLVQISKNAWKTEGSRMFAQVDIKIPVKDLIRGIIIQSGNDASVAMAEQIAGTEETFAQMMNTHAQRLGMKNTHFMNATGLADPQHYTTAEDLSILASALIRDFPDSYKLYSEKWFTFQGIKQPNRNRLLWRDDNVDGIKTGHTEKAGYCLAASAKQKNMRLISIVLGTKNDHVRTEASQQLLRYGFRFYETHKLFSANKPIKEAKVWMGKTKQLNLGVNHDLYVTLPRGQYKHCKASITLNKYFEAPIIKNKTYGLITLKLGDQILIQKPLVALKTIQRGGIICRSADRCHLTVKKLFKSE